MKTAEEMHDDFFGPNNKERYDIVELMKRFHNQFTPKKESKTIEERKTEFIINVSFLVPEKDTKMGIEFIDYWTEISPNAKKMRFEKEKVFDIKKRLERWNKNQKTFNNGKPTKQTRHDKFESAFARTNEDSGTVETFDKV